MTTESQTLFASAAGTAGSNQTGSTTIQRAGSFDAVTFVVDVTAIVGTLDLGVQGFFAGESGAGKWTTIAQFAQVGAVATRVMRLQNGGAPDNASKEEAQQTTVLAAGTIRQGGAWGTKHRIIYTLSGTATFSVKGDYYRST